MIDKEIKEPVQPFEDICAICQISFQNDTLKAQRSESICQSCWFNHINTYASQAFYAAGRPIASPFEGAPPIDISFAIENLSHHHRLQIHEMLFKKYCAFTTDIEKCPTEGCNFVYTLEKCKWKKVEEDCPCCNTSLSQQTKWGIRSILGWVYFLFLINRCPKCNIPIYKTAGCSHMKCSCGHEFCWDCLKDHKKSNQNIYQVHETKECLTIIITRIFFTVICDAGIVFSLFGSAFFATIFDQLAIGLLYILKILILSIIIWLDIYLVHQIFTYEQSYLTRRYNLIRTHGFKKVLTVALVYNGAYLCLLCYLELFTEVFWMLFGELAIFGVIFLIGWVVMQTNQLWFHYIT